MTKDYGMNPEKEEPTEVRPMSISGSLFGISEELDQTDRLIDELGQRLIPVRRGRIEKVLATPSDPVDEEASDIYRRLEGHVYRIMNQRAQLLEILQTLEL